MIQLFQNNFRLFKEAYGLFQLSLVLDDFQLSHKKHSY